MLIFQNTDINMDNTITVSLTQPYTPMVTLEMTMELSQVKNSLPLQESGMDMEIDSELDSDQPQFSGCLQSATSPPPLITKGLQPKLSSAACIASHDVDLVPAPWTQSV